MFTKFIYIFTILILFSVHPIIGQSQVTENDMNEINALINEGESVKALEKINTLKKSIKTKDSQYIRLLIVSTGLNQEVYNCEEVISNYEEMLELHIYTEMECLKKMAEFKKYIGDFAGVITIYQRLIALAPSDNQLQIQLASAYISAHKYDEALELFNNNQKTKLLPQEYLYLATAYYYTDRLDLAKQNIDKYLKTEQADKDFIAYKLAALIYSSLSDNKKSCKYISKAAEIISNTKPDEQVSRQTPKVQSYYFMKELMRHINETKSLQTQYCGQAK